MKTFLLMTLFAFNTNADILKRPDYQADENHPAPLVVMPRQAQEEKVEQRTKKNKRQQEVERENRRKAVERFKETEMTE